MFANHTKISDSDYPSYYETYQEVNETVMESCYGKMSDAQTSMFLQFERIVGGYLNCSVGTLGLIGNVLSIIVLCRKEMRKNCFSQLLIGKHINI